MRTLAERGGGGLARRAAIGNTINRTIGSGGQAAMAKRIGQMNGICSEMHPMVRGTRINGKCWRRKPDEFVVGACRWQRVSVGGRASTADSVRLAGNTSAVVTKMHVRSCAHVC